MKATAQEILYILKAFETQLTRKDEQDFELRLRQLAKVLAEYVLK